MAPSTGLADRALDLVMALFEAPINAVERLIGRGRMPYVFLAPNLVLFGIFTFCQSGSPSAMRSPAEPIS